jgi:hypothetical protein
MPGYERKRIFKEIELMEVSIAPWSMEPKAMVMGVKDAHGNIQSKRRSSF